MSSDWIAVIDDDRHCVDVVADALAREGYRVRTAFCGPDAIDLLRSSSPVLVILNLHLPGANGLRLLADFRRRDAKTPVLVMSHEDRASLHEQALANGANGVLRKPFSAEILLSAVRRFKGEPAASVA